MRVCTSHAVSCTLQLKVENRSRVSTLLGQLGATFGAFGIVFRLLNLFLSLFFFIPVLPFYSLNISKYISNDKGRLTHSSILSTSLCSLSPENVQNYLWFPKEFPLVYIDWRKDQGPVRELFDLSLCDDSTVIPSRAQNSVHACANLCQLMSNLAASHLFFPSPSLSLFFCPCSVCLFIRSQLYSSFPSPLLPDYAEYPQVAHYCVYYTVSVT